LGHNVYEMIMTMMVTTTAHYNCDCWWNVSSWTATVLNICLFIYFFWCVVGYCVLCIIIIHLYSHRRQWSLMFYHSVV